MRVGSTQGEVRFPLMGLVRWIAAPTLAIAVLAGVIAIVRGEAGLLEAEGLAFACVLVGMVVSMFVLAQSPPRIAGAWAGVLLIAQGGRMLASLGIGMVTFFLAHPDPMAFWLLFLALSLAVLASEVAFVLTWIRAAQTDAAREGR